tara:strand:+ start:1111 stop:1293 length:183 start_codon:yes stop_codon:yes gene_type:complete
MKKLSLSKIWEQICVAAIGVNIATIIYALLINNYQLIPLSILNILLLSPVFLITKQKEER